MGKFTDLLDSVKVKKEMVSVIRSLFLILMSIVWRLLLLIFKLYNLTLRFIRWKPGLTVFIFVAALIMESFVITMRNINKDTASAQESYEQRHTIDSLCVDLRLYKQLYTKASNEVAQSRKRDSLRKTIRKIERRKPVSMLKDSVIKHN